jgi:hypothetical protein
MAIDMQRGWRVFWTQQHGDNTTFELLADRATDHGADR